MKLFNILAVLITLSAVFSYINHRFIRLPTTIGIMVIALLVSLGLRASERVAAYLDQERVQLARRAPRAPGWLLLSARGLRLRRERIWELVGDEHGDWESAILFTDH